MTAKNEPKGMTPEDVARIAAAVVEPMFHQLVSGQAVANQTEGERERGDFNAARERQRAFDSWLRELRRPTEDNPAKDFFVACRTGPAAASVKEHRNSWLMSDLESWREKHPDLWWPGALHGSIDVAGMVSFRTSSQRPFIDENSGGDGLWSQLSPRTPGEVVSITDDLRRYVINEAQHMYVSYVPRNVEDRLGPLSSILSTTTPTNPAHPTAPLTEFLFMVELSEMHVGAAAAIRLPGSADTLIEKGFIPSIADQLREAGKPVILWEQGARIRTSKKLHDELVRLQKARLRVYVPVEEVAVA